MICKDDEIGDLKVELQSQKNPDKDSETNSNDQSVNFMSLSKCVDHYKRQRTMSRAKESDDCKRIRLLEEEIERLKDSYDKAQS